MSPDEIKVHDCLVTDEFLRKNQDIKLNVSKHQRMKEALGIQEVRRTIVGTGLVFAGIPGYTWELTFTPHILSIVLINPDLHNAQLAYIAIKSHRRSAYDLQRARGKRRPIIIIIIYPRFNPPTIFSMNEILPFLNLYSYPYRFYSTIGGCYYGCYYGIANYSYSQSQFCSNSSISSSSSSAPPEFLLHEYGIRYIPEPKGHYSMKDIKSYICGLIVPVLADGYDLNSNRQTGTSNARNTNAVLKRKQFDRQTKAPYEILKSRGKKKLGVKAKATEKRRIEQSTGTGVTAI